VQAVTCDHGRPTPEQRVRGDARDVAVRVQ
jgi:hypothetical protein